MDGKMLGLDDMYLFRSIVDCNGLTGAARQLSIPRSTVSRRIADLEKRLGAQLFLRNAREFTLTNFGAECYTHCARLAVQADRVLAMAERARKTPVGTLHVVCPPVLAAMLLDGIAVEFAEASPEVRLHLEETASIYDPRTVRADLVIYPAFGDLPDSSLVARKLFTSPYQLVAHPDLLRVRPIETPEDLKSVRCLGLGGRGTEWRWVLKRGREQVTHRFDPVFSSTLPTGLLQAVQRGFGVASLPVYLCAAELRAGRLAPVLPEWKPTPVKFYAIYPSSGSLTAATRNFLDLLVKRLPEVLRERPESLLFLG